MCQILQVCEATYASLRVIPLPSVAQRENELHVVKLVRGENRFINKGGIAGAGGAYLPDHRHTIIRMNQLLPTFKEDGRIARLYNLDLVVHEITHQVQHDWLEILPTWMIEGMAVYVESVPYHNGTLVFEEMNFRAAKGIQRCTQNRFQIVELDTLMSMDRDTWNESFEKNPSSHNRYYTSAYLLTYYLLHLREPEATMRVDEYFTVMDRANDQSERSAATRELFANKSHTELFQDMKVAYAKQGFHLETIEGYHF